MVALYSARTADQADDRHPPTQIVCEVEVMDHESGFNLDRFSCKSRKLNGTGWAVAGVASRGGARHKGSYHRIADYPSPRCRCNQRTFDAARRVPRAREAFSVLKLEFALRQSNAANSRNTGQFGPGVWPGECWRNAISREINAVSIFGNPSSRDPSCQAGGKPTGAHGFTRNVPGITHASIFAACCSIAPLAWKRDRQFHP
jgi:hypothetical protein